jgi:hypothetical protein
LQNAFIASLLEEIHLLLTDIIMPHILYMSSSLQPSSDFTLWVTITFSRNRVISERCHAKSGRSWITVSQLPRNDTPSALF